MKEKELEKILKAFANHRRLQIIRYLKKEDEASVGDIAGEIRLSFRSTSRHLRVLAVAGILECDQRSLSMYYRIARSDSRIVRAVLSLV